jgi:V/A-type H+/Na+-transporting ATPase subunit E
VSSKSTERANAEQTSSGVSELIERLREDGVAEGRERGQKLVSEAEQKAEEILEHARAKADTIVADARQEAEKLGAAGADALRIAARDTVIEMRETLRQRLEERTKRIVSGELEDRGLLQRLILEIAGSARRDAKLDEARGLEILLPLDALGMDDLRERPLELQDEVRELVKQIASAALREGVSFRALEPGRRGIRVVLTDEGVEIDLTDRAVAEMLLRHLQPRFRALMEGIIR